MNESHFTCSRRDQLCLGYAGDGGHSWWRSHQRCFCDGCYSRQPKLCIRWHQPLMCHIDFPSLPAVQVPEALYTPFLWKTLVCWISMCMYLKLLEYIFIVSETFHQICDMTDPSNMNKDEWDDAGQIQLFACTLGSVKNISWVQDSGHIKKSTTSMDVKEFWHKTDGFKKEKHPTQKITNFQRCGTGPWAVGPSSTNGCHNEQVIFWVLKHKSFHLLLKVSYYCLATMRAGQQWWCSDWQPVPITLPQCANFWKLWSTICWLESIH